MSAGMTTVSQAEYRVDRATEERDKAQTALDAAVAELKALTPEHN